MAEPKIGTNRGAAGKGRPKGSANKTTALLKDAIIRAATAIGFDGKGSSGLVGYCKFLASNEPKAFAQLLGKVLPLQIAGEAEGGGIVVEIVKRGFDS